MCYFNKDFNSFTQKDLEKLKKDILSLKEIQHIEILCILKDKNNESSASYNRKKEQLVFNWCGLSSTTKRQILTVIKSNKK